MTVPSWFRFHERQFPSANTALVVGSRPVLIDSGFGHDAEVTRHLLAEAGVEPAAVALVVNTHHSDHVGGNHELQARFGVAIAAHRWEADMVNDRDGDACAAAWLDQPVQPHEVDVSLADGDIVDAGGPALRVVHTPATRSAMSRSTPKRRGCSSAVTPSTATTSAGSTSTARAAAPSARDEKYRAAGRARPARGVVAVHGVLRAAAPHDVLPDEWSSAARPDRWPPRTRAG